MRLVPALALALALPHAALGAERLAVLELYNPAGLEQQAADYLTDRIRAAALGALGERVKVLTRENLVALMPPGADLADCAGADCEVETGRRLGARFVISGELVRLGETLKLSLKLHATDDGTLLAAEAASGPDAEGLEAALPPVVAALVQPVKRHTPTPIFAAPTPLPAVPAVDAKVGPLAVVGFRDIDLDLLDALQVAHRLEANDRATAAQRAAAWASVAERAEGERAAEATTRAEQWRARHAAEVERARAARAAWARYREDEAKLDRLLTYDASVVPEARKAEWKAAFEAAYAPWQAEFARMTAEVEWVPLPGGDFEWEASSGPARLAPFDISRSEVTVAQYTTCVEAGACAPIDWAACRAGPTLAPAGAEHYGAPAQPAVCLTLAEARAFAKHVGGRLPSPDEWMFAARSGRMTDGYPWGRAPASCERAVFLDAAGPGCGRKATWPVCSRPAGHSRDGLCDMAGNAAEWVEPISGRAPFPARGQGTVMGGGLMHAILDPRIIDHIAPTDRRPHIGFRVARDRRP